MDDEKLEAMRQTLELLMQMHMDNEKRWAETQEKNEQRWAETQEKNEQRLQVMIEAQEKNERRFDAIAHTFETALDSIKRLENIATAHEQRLDDMEEQ